MRCAGDIGDAVAHDEDRNGGKEQVPFLCDARDFVEEGVKVAVRVLWREPLPQARLDLCEVLPVKVVDRVKGLRVVLALSPNRGHEQISWLFQASHPLEVSIEVMRQKSDGVAVSPLD